MVSGQRTDVIAYGVEVPASLSDGVEELLQGVVNAVGDE